MLENQKELNEEFLKAVKVNSMERIIAALQQGANLNAKTIKGNNALFLAANTNNKELFIALLDATQKDIPIDLDNQNNDGNTVLFECVKMPKGEDFVKLLLERNANPNIANKLGITPLLQVCADKKTEMITILTDAPQTDINYVTPFSKTTAYLMAASQAYMEGLEILVNKGVNTNVLDGQGRTALMVALAATITGKSAEKKAQKELINFLIDIESDLSYKVPTGMTAFWLASYRGYAEECTKMLLKGVDVNVMHEIGLDAKTTPLHLWAKSGNPLLVHLILENNGKLGVLDGDGNTPESYGFMNPLLQEMMLNHNADVNTLFNFKDKNSVAQKVPALSLVIKSGPTSFPIMEEMINRGALVYYKEENLNDLKVGKFQPILISMSENAFEVTEYLLNTGKIDVNRHYELVEEAQRQSLLQILVSDYKNENEIILSQQKLKLESIISKDKNDKSGKTKSTKDVDESKMDEMFASLEEMLAFELLMDTKKTELFENLLKAGAKIDNANEKGNTEIFMARKTIFADLLIKEGVNIEHTNHADQNVLYYSVVNNNTPEMITYWKNIFTNKNDPIIQDLFYQIAFEDFSENPYKYKNVRQGLVSYLNREDVDDLFDYAIKDKPVVNIPELSYQDEDGNSPLLVACANNSLSLVKLYIKLNAPVNLANNAGETPLIHALNTKNVQLIETLVKAGADLTITFNGKSLLEITNDLNDHYVSRVIEKALENPEPKQIIEDEEDNTNKVVPKVKVPSMKI